jgi:hypothetical protein
VKAKEGWYSIHHQQRVVACFTKNSIFIFEFGKLSYMSAMFFWVKYPPSSMFCLRAYVKRSSLRLDSCEIIIMSPFIPGAQIYFCDFLSMRRQRR